MTPENLPGLAITDDQLGAIWTPITESARLCIAPQAGTQGPPAVENSIRIAA